MNMWRMWSHCLVRSWGLEIKEGVCLSAIVPVLGFPDHGLCLGIEFNRLTRLGSWRS